MKVKIMNQVPEVADEEIERYKNFDRLLALKKATDLKRQWQIKIFTGSIALTGVILLSVYFLTDHKTESPELVDPRTELKFEKPEYQSIPEIVPLPEEEQNKNRVEKKSQTASKVLEKKESQNEKIQAPVIEESVVAEYQEAEPMLGYTHLYEYLNQELKYPTEALADSIQGILTVSFIINKEGKPENISIQNSLGLFFEREATLLINNMPAWKPAMRNGNPTPSKVSLPLTFQIKKVKIKKP